VASSPVKPS
jgi:hypothetical protein